MSGMAKRLLRLAAFVLAGIALVFCVVSYQARRARAAVQAEDGKVVRQAVEQYTKDTGELPADLEDLVTKGYVKALPAEKGLLISN